MLHAKIQNHRTSGSGEEDLTGLYHIWAWRPSLSCDLDNLYKLMFPLPKNLTLIGQAVSEGKTFEIVDEGRRAIGIL